MRALHRKLFRDLWHLRGQALAIALVLGAGVATYVMARSTFDSLRQTRNAFYRDERFADVFASLKRAPDAVAARVAALEGVDAVETRIVAPVTLEIEGFDEPVTGHLLSLPDAGAPLLNAVRLRRGRMIEPFRDNEVLVSEGFAEAHRFEPGDRLGAIVNGRRRTLTIAGIVLSPEYVYQIAPGAMFPDFERYGVLWMARTPLAAAIDMTGAFNDVALSLAPGAEAADVLDGLDALLESYGGLGAYDRANQISHRYLSEEFRQLDQMATLLPGIFLGVAAFLLHLVVGRLVQTQREQIAALKAFGYGNLAISLHYLEMILIIVLVGASAGLAAGIWTARGMGEMYMEYYRFPAFDYVLRPRVGFTAVLISAGASVVGTLAAVRAATLLAPAVAMRPEPPARYRESVVELAGLRRFLSQPSRMIVRHLERRPFKALLTTLGIALACAILVVGGYFVDAIDHMVAVQFNFARREDMAVTFAEPTSYRAGYELARLEGVERVEPFRSVPVRLRHGHRTYRTAVLGLEPGSDLARVLDTELKPIPIPEEGLLLTDYLGKLLGLAVGDSVSVEVLEGRRQVVSVPVTGFAREYMGASGYMNLDALGRLLHERETLSGVYLAADAARQSELHAALKRRPRVAGISERAESMRNFRETFAEHILTFVFTITLFAGVIAFGVVYNSARISVSERSRELASLRVLGLTRAEISYVLLGELAVLTLAALPLGFVLGRAFCAYVVAAMQSDLYRIPLVFAPRTYALAATVVLASAAISGLIVRHRLDHLDLVEVLKTRE